MLRFSPLFALAGALALAAPAAAQTPDTIEALTPGRRALSFNLPNGGGLGLGVWRVVAPDRARGFFVNLSGGYDHASSDYPVGESSGSSYHVSASVGPVLRRYLGRSGPVAPFVQSGVFVGGSYQHQSQTAPGPDPQSPQESGSHGWAGNLGASLAGGVEWFPLRRVSLAGQTGLSASVSYGRSSNESSGVETANTAWSVHVGTFVSSLMLQIYF